MRDGGWWTEATATAVVGLRFALGGVLVSAGIMKFTSGTLNFQRVVSSYDLLPAWAVPAVGRSIPRLEISLGVCLILGVFQPWPAIGAAALLSVFTAAIAINLFRGRLDLDCGCLGTTRVHNLGWSLFISRLVMVGANVLVATVRIATSTRVVLLALAFALAAIGTWALMYSLRSLIQKDLADPPVAGSG